MIIFYCRRGNMRTCKWMICFGLLAISSTVFAQEAVITEERHMIKTYPFSDPDPLPIMIRTDTAGKGPKLYPYFFFDQLSPTGTETPWNVVHMENPYIDVYIIPDEGGKLLGASEKSTGNEFIYHNHVRKYRQLAFRGPWTSGGIELNFGFVGTYRHNGVTCRLSRPAKS